MALSGGGGAGALFLGFIGFVVIVISIIFLSQKPSTSPAPAPVVGQEPGAPEPAQSPAPAPAPEPVPAPGPAPGPAPAPLVFGSITPRGPAPAPAPIIQQVFTTPPPPYDTPLDKLLNFLEGIPDMLLNRQNLVLAIADLIINKQKSMVYELVKGLFQKIARSPALVMKIRASIQRRVAARTATGAIRGKFKFMSLLERARLGLSWGKTSAKLGENTGAKLAQEAGTRFNVAGALGKAAAQAGSATVSAGKLAGSLARGLVTDPLMVVAVTGMALDSKNVGNFARLTQTSDMLVERNAQLKLVAEATVDCSADPLGPKCPPSPGAVPAPGPAPPPKAGRFPRFLGPHDLMPVEAMFADLETNISSLVGDPSGPKGPLKITIDMIPSSTYLDVKNSLTALYNSIDITVAGMESPFIYTSPASQTIVQNAIKDLKSKPTTTLLAVVINRLEIIFLMQGVVSDYIAQIRGNNYGDISDADFQQLAPDKLTDDVIDKLTDALLDFNCVQNGGLVFNPGNGYDAHTCTWATKQDCHGAFPWALTDGTVIDDATQRTKDMMCTTTCPAPCPAGSPTPCPPPVSCPAPSPCAAISDPSKLDLTYTEWRSKDWFSKANWISSNPAWNVALDQNAIPSGGACIAADAGVHSFCDDTQTTTAGSANNIYIRETGTCVNSRKLCDIKGVSYDGNMDASKLGGGNVENANYPSCYRTQNQQIVEDILGATITRFANSGATLDLTIKPVSTGDTTVDLVLNTLGQGLATAAGVIATGSAQALVAVTTSAVSGGTAAVTTITTEQTWRDLVGLPDERRLCPSGQVITVYAPGGGNYICCPNGQDRPRKNTITGQWVCDCPPGSNWYNNKCVTCPSGAEFIRDYDGKCCPTCPAGQLRVPMKDKTCVCRTCQGPAYTPVSNGSLCCPTCTGGGTADGNLFTGCTCTCPAGKYLDDTGTNCVDIGSCAPGRMYTGTGRPSSASDCVPACSGATPVWNPDTRTCVATNACPSSRPYINPIIPSRTNVSGITNVAFCNTGCETPPGAPRQIFADETTRTCVGSCPSGTTIDYLTKKCVGQGACPPAKPWYDINAKSCLNDTELGLFGSAKYQSVSSKPGKLGVCAQGKKKNTGTTGGLCVPVSSGEKDQMTDVIGNYGWNILGFGNDTAAAAYCSANGGALMNPKTCGTCGSGQYVNPSTGQCTNCPADTYKLSNGWKQSDCLACPSGTSTYSGTGKTNSAACISTAPCPSGSTRNSSGTCVINSCPVGQQKNSIGNYCEACPVGTYKTDTSINSCTACPSGLTTASTGSTASSACVTAASLNTGSYTVYDNSYVGSNTAEWISLATKINGSYATRGSLNACKTTCQSSSACGGFTRFRTMADDAAASCSFWSVDGAKNRRVSNQYNKTYVKN